MPQKNQSVSKKHPQFDVLLADHIMLDIKSLGVKLENSMAELNDEFSKVSQLMPKSDIQLQKLNEAFLKVKKAIMISQIYTQEYCDVINPTLIKKAGKRKNKPIELSENNLKLEG